MGKDIKDRVKSYEDACKALGEQPITNFGNATPDEIAYKKLKTVIKALNEGWTPDYTDEEQFKWYPDFKKWKGSNLEFSLSFGTHTSLDAACATHFCLKSKKLANYAGEQFLDLWEDYLL
jgi:hypothetical protein